MARMCTEVTLHIGRVELWQQSYKLIEEIEQKA